MKKTDSSGDTTVGEQLKFERKDVWDMKWAEVTSIEHLCVFSVNVAYYYIVIQVPRPKWPLIAITKHIC